MRGSPILVGGLIASRRLQPHKARAAHGPRRFGNVLTVLMIAFHPGHYYRALLSGSAATFLAPAPLRSTSHSSQPFNFAPPTSWTSLYIVYDAARPVAGSS